MSERSTARGLENIGLKMLKSVLPILCKSVLLASNICVNQALNIESGMRFCTFYIPIYHICVSFTNESVPEFIEHAAFH